MDKLDFRLCLNGMVRSTHGEPLVCSGEAEIGGQPVRCTDPVHFPAVRSANGYCPVCGDSLLSTSLGLWCNRCDSPATEDPYRNLPPYLIAALRDPRTVLPGEPALYERVAVWADPPSRWVEVEKPATEAYPESHTIGGIPASEINVGLPAPEPAHEHVYRCQDCGEIGAAAEEIERLRDLSKVKDAEMVRLNHLWLDWEDKWSAAHDRAEKAEAALAEWGRRGFVQIDKAMYDGTIRDRDDAWAKIDRLEAALVSMTEERDWWHEKADQFGELLGSRYEKLREYSAEIDRAWAEGEAAVDAQSPLRNRIRELEGEIERLEAASWEDSNDVERLGGENARLKHEKSILMRELAGFTGNA